MIREIDVDLVEGLAHTTKEAVAYLSISHTTAPRVFPSAHWRDGSSAGTRTGHSRS